MTENTESPDLEAFRAEVRAFLDEKFDAQMREQTARQTGVFAEAQLAWRWHAILHERGWIAPAWPKEYGGPGWTPEQRSIFADECARVGTPSLPSMGLSLCGPVIMRYGTQEQKDYFLPRMLSGEHRWCQGYSEPGSGSDLASLQLRAVRDGDHYVVNGSKIWTTHAHTSNWIFLLTRTSTEGKPQAGITFMVSPMDAPGISVRPIISISGEHEVNQVFFDNVRIPVANRMGEENEGWTVAKYLLEFERGGGSASIGWFRALHATLDMAKAQPADADEALIEDPAYRRKVSELEIQLLAGDWLEQRYSAGVSTGQSVGSSASSVKKLMASTYSQFVAELAVETLGVYATADQRAAIGVGANEPPIGPDFARTPMARHLNNRASTIFGGSSEIQHNILAKTALGL